MDKHKLRETIERGWNKRKNAYLKEEKDAGKQTGEGTMTAEEENEMQAKDSEVRRVA